MFEKISSIILIIFLFLLTFLIMIGYHITSMNSKMQTDGISKTIEPLTETEKKIKDIYSSQLSETIELTSSYEIFFKVLIGYAIICVIVFIVCITYTYYDTWLDFLSDIFRDIRYYFSQKKNDNPWVDYQSNANDIDNDSHDSFIDQDGPAPLYGNNHENNNNNHNINNNNNDNRELHPLGRRGGGGGATPQGNDSEMKLVPLFGGGTPQG